MTSSGRPYAASSVGASVARCSLRNSINMDFQECGVASLRKALVMHTWNDVHRALEMALCFWDPKAEWSGSGHGKICLHDVHRAREKALCFEDLEAEQNGDGRGVGRLHNVHRAREKALCFEDHEVEQNGDGRGVGRLHDAHWAQAEVSCFEDLEAEQNGNGRNVPRLPCQVDETYRSSCAVYYGSSSWV